MRGDGDQGTVLVDAMRPRRKEEGQSIVLAVLCLTAILGFVGLAIDVGVLRTDRILLQTVADSAAIAGASEVKYGDVALAAQTDAVKNGFVIGASAAALVINNPPLNGPHTADSNYVEVVATESAQTTFMGLFGMRTVIIKARAVAGLGSGAGCIFALNPTASGAILLNGTGNVVVQCGVVDDSNSSTALNVNGNVNFSASSIGVVGGYSRNGNTTVSPTPVTGLPPDPDPLSYLPKPGVGACNYNSYKINGSGTYTVSPGVYCSGLTINGTATVTFNPGLYIINNGAFTINGNANVHGTGVFFYLTGNASFTWNGGSALSFIAPTSGTYEGVLLFQDPGDTSTGTINGNNASVIQGAVYMPKAPITINGTGSTAAYTILVVDKATFNGNSTFNDNYTTLPNGSPIKAAHLTE